MIAVVGAGGFIGANLVDKLAFYEHPVRNIYHGDAFDFHGCETVYNCAGVTGGSGFAAADPLAMVGANLRIALDVFDAALRDGVRHVIAMSSTTGYPDADRPLSEGECFDGEVMACYRNPGETRRFIERLGRMYPFDVTFVRCSGSYGPGDDFDPITSHVIGATIRKVAERQDPLVIWGDGQDERDGTYIDDLCEALVAMLPLTGKESINIGTGHAMSVKDMVLTLCMHANHHPKIVMDESKPKMIRRRMLDCSKAKRLLGWEPRVIMEDGLIKTYEWFIKHAR